MFFLQIQLSSYYEWITPGISDQQIHRNHSLLLVKASYAETKERYGYERLQAHITAQVHKISNYIVRSIEEKYDINCKLHKKFKVTTNSEHNKTVYTNRLEQNFEANRPNQAWVSDITYIWTSEGLLYLTGVEDLYTKEVVGYSINKQMTTDLVCNALNMTIRNKKPSKGLIVHTDTGSQCCSYDYRNFIKHHKFKGSMSCKGNITIVHL